MDDSIGQARLNWSGLVSVSFVLAVLVIFGAYVGTRNLGPQPTSISTTNTGQGNLKVAVGSVDTPGFPSEVALNPDTGKIYVSDLFANMITVVNSTSLKIITNITLPGTPNFGIAIDPSTNRIYVPVAGCTNLISASNSCDGTSVDNKGSIVEIDGGSNSIVGDIGVNANILTIDPATQVLWAVSGSDVLSIDAGSGSVVANIPVNASALLSIAVDPVTDAVFVGACFRVPLVCQGAQVIIVNGSTQSVQSVVNLDFDALNFPVVVNPSTDTAFAMGLAGSDLEFVSILGSTGQIMTSARLGGSCAGAGGGYLAVNSLTNQVYVAGYSLPALLVVDGSSGQIVNMVNTSGTIYGLYFDPSAPRIYVTTDLSVSAGELIISSSNLNSTNVNYSSISQGTCLP